MEISSINTNLRVVSGKTSKQRSSRKVSKQTDAKYPLPVDVVRECMDGVLVFSEQQTLLYASEGAHKILNRLHQEAMSENIIPDEILHICQLLTKCRQCFPHQNWLIEFDIFTRDGVILHIRSRWLKVEQLDQPCLLLVVEDRQQAITNIVMEEAKQYGLTPREKEVWMLHRNDLTYKQIAIELGITPNTVKKHMRSIHGKKKLLTPTMRVS